MQVSRARDRKPRFHVLVIPVELAELAHARGTDIEESMKIPAVRRIV